MAAIVLVVAVVLLALAAAGVPPFGLFRASSKTPVSTGSSSASPLGTDPAQFFMPQQAAFSGSTVWITNQYSPYGSPYGPNGYIDELNANTGRVIRVLDARQDGLDNPYAIVASGRYVWVQDSQTNRVAQLRVSDGSLVRVFSSGQPVFTGDAEMALCGGSLWTITGSDTLAEMSEISGRVERIVNLGVNSPLLLATEGSRLWVSYDVTSPVTDLNCRTGSVIQTFYPAVRGSNGVDSLVAAGSRLWLLYGGSTVFQINGGTLSAIRNLTSIRKAWRQEGAAIQAQSLWVLDNPESALLVVNLSTGRLIRSIPLRNFDQPTYVGISGGRVWLLDGAGDSVDVFDAATGASIWHFGRKLVHHGCGCLP